MGGSGQTIQENKNLGNLQAEIKKVALVGSPNVGKSLIFNALTGSYVSVSNYPGTSVELTRGKTKIQGRGYEIIDTPGMYSLSPITEEERVARQILLAGEIDLIVHVVDARAIERMLLLTLQLMETGLPVILVVNILDEAQRLGLTLDLSLLSARLGIPVVGTVMKRKVGLAELRKAIHDYPQVGLLPSYGQRLEGDITEISSSLRGDYNLSLRSLALLLLQRDEEIIRLVEKQEGEHFAVTENLLREKIFQRRGFMQMDLAMERKNLAASLLSGVIQQSYQQGDNVASRLSRLTMNPWTGGIFLLLILYFGLYQFVGVFGAGTLVDFFEGTIFETYLNPWFEEIIRNLIPWILLQDLFVGPYGVLTMGLRYAVGIILPIVLTFFLFFSILEDTGYLPRLAMLLDRFFKLLGLSGRAVIPMVLGLGCGTMATMVTRTLETKRERIIATLLIALAIPCSAQLGVILALLSGVPGALGIWLGVVLLVMILVGYLTSRLLPGGGTCFYQEIPPLRIPQAGNVFIKTYSRMQWYLMEIIPLFILASVILWAGQATGLFDRLVGAMSVLMRALGLPDQAAVAFVMGFFRRDYGAAGLYDLETQGLLDARQLAVAAVTLTLFVPCVAQFLIMLKERGTKVAMAIFFFVSTLAFFVGFVLNRLIIYGKLL